MRKRKRLGEMLVEAGIMTQSQLQESLANKGKTDLKLGQYLIRQSIISESQLLELLSKQLNVEKYLPEKYPLDPDLAKLMSSEFTQKNRVIPLRKLGSLLRVGMVDPLDLPVLDTLELQLNLEVDPVICTEQEFNLLYNALYGAYTDLDGVLSGVEQAAAEEGAPLGAQGSDDVEVSSLQDMAQEIPVVRLVNSILSQAIREKASDIHLSPEKDYVQVRFRVDGMLHEVPAPPKSLYLPIVSRIKILSDLDIASTRVPQDGRFTIRMQDKEINVRVSCLPTIYGENVVLRLLDMSSGVYSLDRLGMGVEDCRKIEAMMNKPYGMILSTGPTGSGKSTTLYSVLKQLNKPDINIITLEDPVEYRVRGIRQVQLNRKAGMTFASGLRSILRQDPDVVMLGEIRDTETARIATQAALTGHRVLSTVHTNDAAGAITRFLDMDIEAFLVASVILVSCAQRLVRTVCPNCREPYDPPHDALTLLGLSDDQSHNFYRGRGCMNCMETGYKGRTGVYEVLVIDEQIQDMILRRETAVAITRGAQEQGKLTLLKEDAADKVRQGITTAEEAIKAVMT